MRVSKCITAIAAAAFFAMLTCRSEASSFVMPGLQTGGAARSITTAFAPPGKGGKCQHGAPCRPKCKKLRGISPAYLFASDNVTGNVYEYCEDMTPGTTPQVTYPRWGGWGLAVYSGLPRRLAVGVKNAAGMPGTISIYNVNAAGVLNRVGPFGKLQLGTPNANALGLCFDTGGGLYATNYPTAEIDYFSPGLVGGGVASGPTSSWQAQDNLGNPFLGYYLACDVDAGITTVMVDGVDNSGNVDVDEFGGPVVTLSQTLGPLGPDFPGGMTLNSNHNLVVSNTSAGVLIDLGAVAPWNNPGNDRVCLVPGFPENAYLPIVFDDAQNEIWAGNLMPVSSIYNTDAVSNAYPFVGSNCVVGPSGGPSAIILREQFFGIAVSPNTGV